MAEPLKTFFSPALAQRLGESIHAVHPDFPVARFVEYAAEGLDERELLDRARHLADALARFLPPAYPDAIDVLVRSLGPEHATDELLGVGMAPFFYLPHVEFVAKRGLDHFDLSMRAQHALTRRFSAESSIRPFLRAEPERTLAVLAEWIDDPNPHVRRLVSEGTRLRLPWAMRVPWLDRHPERVLALLERLRDDPTTLVRRSVANNLNDLGKVHPEHLARTCLAWMRDATPERRALVEHALRSAVKRGEPGALAILGYGGRPAVAVSDVRFEPIEVPVGGSVGIRFALGSAASEAQALLVDLAVHFVKARGNTSPKVFKVGRLSLEPGESIALRHTVSLAVHSTRAPRPGVHAVDVLVNGAPIRLGSFVVVESPPFAGAAVR